MKKTVWIVAGILFLIMLRYKDLIIGGFFFLIALLLFVGPFLLITWYVWRTTYKNHFSLGAKIRQQEEKEERKRQEAIQIEKDRPIYNKRSTWTK